MTEEKMEAEEQSRALAWLDFECERDYFGQKDAINLRKMVRSLISTKQEAGEVSRSQTAAPFDHVADDVLRRALADARVCLTNYMDRQYSNRVLSCLDRIAAALSLPAPDAGWRDALEKAYAVLGAAHSRIHCLPRTSDTELAKRIEQMRAEIERALLPLPAPPVGGSPAEDSGPV